MTNHNGHEGTIPHLELDDQSVANLLEAMHKLLLAHKYDHAVDEALQGLTPHVPALDGYYERLKKGEVEEGMNPPPAAVALDDVLAVAQAHVREAMLVGYLLGSLHTRITTYVAPDKVALQVVRTLGLEEAMQANLGYGYRLTDKALTELRRRPANGQATKRG